MNRISVCLISGLGLVAACTEENSAEDEFAEDEFAEDDFAEDDFVEEASGGHCVLRAGASQAVCFSRFSEAIAFSTGEVLPPNALPAEYIPTITATAGNRANVVVALGYDSKNFWGSSLQLLAPSGCNWASQYWTFATLPAYWNDRFSSIDVLEGSGCESAVLYEHANLGGAKLTIGGAKADFGALDNKVSSIKVWW